jgi:hypothetical protein
MCRALSSIHSTTEAEGGRGEKAKEKEEEEEKNVVDGDKIQ